MNHENISEQTPQNAKQQILNESMNIVIVGHVDHGKSTVIGRLLADTNSLPEGKLEQVKETCRRNAKPFEYAFLLDALKEEQAQGITIDTARVFFKTDKRKYIIIDAPGHIEFLKNMVTGAARAEAALLVIDANEGVMENSKRHGYLLSMLGIKQVVILVNKMDLIGYDKLRFEQITEEYKAFLAEIGVKANAFIPISGFEGDNVAVSSDKMPWYKGMTVLEKLDALINKKNTENQIFRMPVQGVYKFTAGGDDRRIVAGTIDTGKVRIGDGVVFYPSGKKSKVKSIERFNAPQASEDTASSATGFTLEEQIYITRGELACLSHEAKPEIASKIKAKLFWLGREDLNTARSYFLKIGTQKIKAELEEVVNVLDASSLNTTNRQFVKRHEVAEVILKLDKEIAFDQTENLIETSRFVIIDDYEISGGGIIACGLEDISETNKTGAIESLSWIESSISKEERAIKNGQKPALILFDGTKDINIKDLVLYLEKAFFRYGRNVLNLNLESEASLKRSDVMSKFAEISSILLYAGNIIFAAVNDLKQSDINILSTKVDLEAIKIICVGEVLDNNMPIALQIKEHAAKEEIYRHIKEMMIKHKLIFEPYNI
ncbi:sulfate adenylyltransferase subunit 1 [Cellulosilyticum sp. I15G10I2]|uniref:sulfate adenylyltransferase subunit 1 n=1 Tax=Cellulosilyticum sp. I15G10I2 TaxID=1892843 RepID=UPI00085C2825|nr:GTP-binding protein [Cellulosilyticum sp. I15G10I2]